MESGKDIDGGARREEESLCNGFRGGDEVTMDHGPAAVASSSKLLVVGNYCHDTINPPPGGGGRRTDTLGGSAAYVSNVLCSLGIKCDVVAKVGLDFGYGARVSVPPAVAATSPTTHFIAEYSAGEDRLLRADRLCEPIYPSDLQCSYFDLGLAVGVAGEILPETLDKIIQLCGRVVVDVQALIRIIDPATGEVICRKLEETPFDPLLDRISFIKAAHSEAEFMDVDSLRQRTCVIITKGAQGCSIYLKNKEYHVPTFPTQEVDPTGAGDSFLGGFAAGLHAGLSVDKAALLGNYFGALAVAQIGVPSLSQSQIEEARKVLLDSVCSRQD